MHLILVCVFFININAFVYGIKSSLQQTLLQTNQPSTCAEDPTIQFTANDQNCTQFRSCINSLFGLEQAYQCIANTVFDRNSGVCQNDAICVESPELPNVAADLEIDIVPVLPDGVFQDCSRESLQNMPARCASLLRENSTDAERLGCALISQPNSQGMIPFGLYPSTTMVDTPLENVHQTGIPLFDDCAMAQMLENKCFLFSRNPEIGYFKFYAYATADEYAESMSDIYAYTAQAEIDFFVVSLKASYIEASAKYSSHDAQFASAAVDRRWVQEIGSLTMDTCFQDPSWLASTSNILNPAYLDLWRNISTLSVNELLENSNFKSIIEAGLFFATSFNMGAEYHYDTNIKYKAKQEYSESSQYQGYQVGVGLEFESADFEVGLGGQHGTHDHQAQGNSSAQIILKNYEIKYGDCDFEVIRKFDTDSMKSLVDCATQAGANISTLPQFTNIPSGGFSSVMSIIESLNISISPDFEAAYIIYAKRCVCDDRGNSTSFTCYNTDGTTYKKSELIMMCDSDSWFLHDGYPNKMPLKIETAANVTLNTDTDFFNVTSPSGVFNAYLLYSKKYIVTPGIVYGSEYCLSSSCGAAYEWYFSTETGELRNSVEQILPRCNPGPPGTYGLIVTDQGILKAYNTATQETCNFQIINTRMVIFLPRNLDTEKYDTCVQVGYTRKTGEFQRYFFISNSVEFLRFVDVFGWRTIDDFMVDFQNSNYGK